MTYGVYLVTGSKGVHFRGHAQGETFTAKLPVNQERRAIERGDIRLLERLVPTIDPACLTFPVNWLPRKEQ